MCKRSRYNHNLRLHHEPTYKGFNLRKKNSPYFGNFLDNLHGTIQRSLRSQPRTLAVVFCLHMPFNSRRNIERNPITDFMEYLKRGIKSHANMKRQLGKRVHPCFLEYVVKVEQKVECPLEHYHVVLLLNKDEYYHVGNLSHLDQSILGQIIRKAWLKVHKIDENSPVALVHGSNPSSIVIQGEFSPVVEEHQAAFRWLSYLCKEETTKYQGRHQSFYTSNAYTKAPVNSPN